MLIADVGGEEFEEADAGQFSFGVDQGRHDDGAGTYGNERPMALSVAL